MNDSALNGGGDSFGTIRDPQFSQDALQMVFGRVFSNREDVRNLFVGKSLGELIQDLYLARREIRKGVANCQPGGYLLRNPTLSCGDRSQGGDQFLTR